MPRYDADWIDYMLRPERRGSPPAEETVAYLGIAPGQTVADVGCGPGYFTLPIARVVGPTGLVYAIDTEPSMLDLVASRAATAGVAGIETRRAEPQRIPLDDGVADLSLGALILHDLPDRLHMVRELIRVTRPGGRIAVVEWVPDEDERRPNRMRPAEVSALFAQASRPVSEVTPLGSGQYLVIAR